MQAEYNRRITAGGNHFRKKKVADHRPHGVNYPVGSVQCFDLRYWAKLTDQLGWMERHTGRFIGFDALTRAGLDMTSASLRKYLKYGGQGKILSGRPYVNNPRRRNLTSA